MRGAIAIAGGVLLASLALAGCGGGSSGSTAGAANGNLERVSLDSPAVAATAALPARYTCDGQNTSLPLRWRDLPHATRELLLLMFAISTSRTPEGVREKVSVLWGVAGLPPTLHELAPGRLPPGAVLGSNDVGQTRYSICPPRGTNQSYLIMLFASPRRLSLPPGFSDEAVFHQLSSTKPPFGALNFTYARSGSRSARAR
ncbi:MAG: YbhB/YbcL family Raf kinase inhibitor-like protein [Solirubrobacteraceae bacterium]